MQENARYQAVLELIEDVFQDKKPADNIINSYLRDRTYIGSKDRRFITDTIWKIIRNRMKLEFDANSNDPRRILITYLKDENVKNIFTGEKYAPYALTDLEEIWLEKTNEEVYPDHVEAECPKWLFNKINDTALVKSLNETAEADFRINVKNRDAIIEKLKGEGLEFIPTPYSPIGIRSQTRVTLGNCVAYQEGEIEVQDEASQIAAILCDVSPNHKTVDYCCGAGGKSLTMAYLMGNQGKIMAHDISEKRLDAIYPRLERLKVTNIELCKAIKDKDFDRFIIDAPCSGTGTWRRSPDAKYRLTNAYLEGLTKSQMSILHMASERTVVGGRIVYITCSILHDENEAVIEKFLKFHENFETVNIKELWDKKIDMPYPARSEKCLRMSPLTTNTDGFFIAILERKS